MRDPKRIERMLGKLGQLWKQTPDWRLGQLLLNVGFPESPAAFYMFWDGTNSDYLFSVVRS